jgi:Cytochrome c554 and c-prime
MRGRAAGLCLCLLLSACDSAAEGGGETATASLSALQDPETCQPCHAEHYAEWESSMHAYAAKDPVFIAMNERGQRETDGALGEFCVRCHAPMALELGLTRDGLNLPDLPDPNARGVTCYFCHDAHAIDDDHNRGLSLAHDAVMRGGLGPRPAAGEPANASEPHANPVHRSAYSPLHDSHDASSAAMCGGCHDIVNDAGVALERSFVEWRASRFSKPGADLQTCATCHMLGYDGQAAAGAQRRRLHRHMWPGVDTALTDDYPGVGAQMAAIDCTFRDAIELTLTAADNRASVTLRNRAAGHAWPSGAAQDRRAWVELIAYDAAGQILQQSGVVEDGAVAANEPSLEVLHDRLYSAAGQAVHMFWQAAGSEAHPLGYESDLLSVPDDAAAHSFSYPLPAAPTRITARLRLQAIGLDVIDDFAGIELPITEKVLNSFYMQNHSLRSRIRTITVPGSERELRVQDGELIAVDPAPTSASDCAAQAYVSLLSKP